VREPFSLVRIVRLSLGLAMLVALLRPEMVEASCPPPPLVPDPTLSLLPHYINLVGQTGNDADPSGLFHVTILDANGCPVVNSTVAIDFTNTTMYSIASPQGWPGVSAHCASHVVFANADNNGVATFSIIGSLIQHPADSNPVGSCIASISADGVLLGSVPVAAFDLDGVNGVTTNDLHLWECDYAAGTNPCYADYDHNGVVDLADLSIAASVCTGHGSLQTGNLCQPLGGGGGELFVTGGLGLTSTQCMSGIYSGNPCVHPGMPWHTDFVGTVTLPSFSFGTTDLTGVEAIIHVTGSSGVALSNFWSFQLGQCDASHMTPFVASPGGFDCMSTSPAWPSGTGWARLSLNPAPASSQNVEELRILEYAIPPGCYGQIPLGSTTVAVAFEVDHVNASPSVCAGCGDPIAVSLESLKFTLLTPDAPDCTAGCMFPETGASDARTMAQAYVLTVTPGPTDSNVVFVNGVPSGYVGVSGTTGIPTEMWLRPVWPNPTGSGATIRFGLPTELDASLALFDVSGRRVDVLVEGVQPAGERSVVWDGRDGSGHRVTKGVYFVHLRAGGRVLTRAIVVTP
jgi:hypothetical protein